jgi:uroporphyrinogen III methyltransferase/synthase
VISRFDQFDVVIFCSENGVHYFMDHFTRSTLVDLRSFAGKTISCVGSKTASKLCDDYHLRCDVVPDDYSAESLAKTLASDIKDQRVLIIRASRGADTLPRLLTNSGALVHEVVAYDHRDVTDADSAIKDMMRQGLIDWTTITSSATAESLYRMFGDSLSQTKIASLSPITSKTITDLGLTVTAQADPFTIDSLIEKVLES